MKNYPEILRSIGGYFDEAAQREISCAEVADYIEKLEAELATLRQQQREPVVWRYVDCVDEGTCCYVYNEMGHGEPLYREAAPEYKGDK